MVERTDNPSQQLLTGILRPEYVLPALTLLLYLVVSSHVRGFLRFFFAQPEWFNPSLFGLVSFSGTTILVVLSIVAVSTTLLVQLTSPTPGRSAYLWICLWILGIAYVVIPYAHACWSTLRQINTFTLIAEFVSIGLLAVTPFWGWIGYRIGYFQGKREANSKHRDYSPPSPAFTLLCFSFTIFWGTYTAAGWMGFSAAARIDAAIHRLRDLPDMDESTPPALRGLAALSHRPLFTDGTAVLLRQSATSFGCPVYSASPDHEEIVLVSFSDLAAALGQIDANVRVLRESVERSQAEFERLSELQVRLDQLAEEFSQIISRVDKLSRNADVHSLDEMRASLLRLHEVVAAMDSLRVEISKPVPP